MANLLTPETFEFFARYILAGFVIYSIRSKYVVGDRPKQTEILFEIVLLSLLNQAIYLALVQSLSWFFGFEPTETTQAPFQLLFFYEVLAQPAAIGFLLGVNLSRGWNHAIARRLSMPIVQPTRRAYDHVFGELRRSGFVIVSFQDGTTVYGYYGENSFAGSDRENGDIYLEDIYTLSGSDTWERPDPPRSVLLSLEGMRSIEMIGSERGE